MTTSIIAIIAIVICALGAFGILYESWNEVKFLHQVKSNPYHPARNNPLKSQTYIPVGFDGDVVVMAPDKHIDTRV